MIAGIIFTYTSYHMAHSLTHIGLSMIVWLPIFILFLFKLLEKESKFYPIIGGIIFLMVSLTHLYYTVFILMFAIIFFLIYIFREKKISNKIFVVNFSILFIIGLTSVSLVLLLNPVSNDELPNRPLFEHNMFSINLENLILPTPEHTTQIISDYGIIQSFYTFFNVPFDSYQLQIENLVFLGYSVIFLSAPAIIKYRQKHVWFWLLITGIFILMSLGPELKIFHESTGIILPERIFYDTIPEWDEIRAPARFIVIADLALAILVSYSVYGLIKNKFSSFKQQLILSTIIAFVILFEFSFIPYPANSESIPEIYEEIKNDKSKFTILPAPIGGTGEELLQSDPLLLYHQIYHEKPIYGGMESRVSSDAIENTQTYFLNMFRLTGIKDDVIKQDLSTYGLSIFEHLNIKYVVLHKKLELSIDFLNNFHRETFLPETKDMMSKILMDDKPIYEDDKIVVYKIPKPDSTKPFLMLGSGWHLFEAEHNARATMKDSEILIINPSNTEKTVTVKIILSSIGKEKILTASLNNKNLGDMNIPTETIGIQLKDLNLKPGMNVILLSSDEFVLISQELSVQRPWLTSKLGTTMSFKVESINLYQ